MALRSGIHVAETEEEKQAIYRFRYDVYVEEMGRYRQIADHDKRVLIEPEDAYSRLSYVAEDGQMVATARTTWGADAPFPQRMIDQYGLAPFLAEMAPETIAVGERGMVARRLRGSDLMLRMMREMIKFANAHRIELCFGNCEPHLLNLYLGLGHRTYSKRNFNSSEAGYLVPIVFVPEDVAYLRYLGSPLLDSLTDFGADTRIPACLQRIAAAGTAVRSRRLTSSDQYWSEIRGALDELEENRVSALDGLTAGQAEHCLGKSSIIECQNGDRVLKVGGVARNMFVVLNGALEVRDGDHSVAVLQKGDILGEMAFLLERPRTRDVYAIADGTRILSLSESELRKMIDSDSKVAATLLLNISKILCHRLIRNR